MAYNGVNAHNAADLLRQAMAKNSAKSENGDISECPTPSGVQTPQPDPADKRMPGIMSNFFGQVGNPPSSKSTSQDSLSNSSSRSSSSLVMVEHASPDKKQADIKAGSAELRPPASLLTPCSSSSSLLQKDLPSAENGRPEVDTKSFTQALKGLVLTEKQTSLPVASISLASVPSAHISNPVSQTLASDSPVESVAKVSLSSKIASLTSSATAESRAKNTPPLTPRALSHEEGNQGKTSPLARPSMTAEEEKPVEKVKSSASSPTRNGDLPTRSPKGKLLVKIDEARGLKASYDPYVVCVFECSEYISRGPKPDAMDLDDNSLTNPLRKDDVTFSSVAMRRVDSESGKAKAIPMKNRQDSNNSELDGMTKTALITDPQWDHEATFDVLGRHSELDISVYDRTGQESILGHLRLCLNLTEKGPLLEGWFPLEGAEPGTNAGEIHLRTEFQKTEKKLFGPNDFQILKLIGKGTFGQVYQVRKKDTQRIYAMKVLSKKVIIQKKEVAHTLGERNILVRTATGDSPFIVSLKFSFQTPSDLYLVTDFMSGGELFWHLQKEGRFQEARAKFYIAELILALQHLHQYDIVYRDLKPENILLDANGHIALCDFGLSKANLTKNETTNTFCGTTEYLAPEVLLDEAGYTKMVDFWSLGVLVFEMCCGWSPFYAEDTQQMYKNIAFGKVRFPRDALSVEGRNFVKGLLNRNPKHRLGANRDAQELIEHPFFDDIDWTALAQKNITPPFKPKLKSVMDTSNFDPEFTTALDTSSSLNARAVALAGGGMTDSTPLSPTMQNAFKGFTFVDESSIDSHFPQDEGVEYPEDTGWLSPQQSNTSANRMSGIVKQGEGEGDGMFGNQSGFEL